MGGNEGPARVRSLGTTFPKFFIPRGSLSRGGGCHPVPESRPSLDSPSPDPLQQRCPDRRGADLGVPPGVGGGQEGAHRLGEVALESGQAADKDALDLEKKIIVVYFGTLIFLLFTSASRNLSSSLLANSSIIHFLIIHGVGLVGRGGGGGRGIPAAG